MDYKNLDINSSIDVIKNDRNKIKCPACSSSNIHFEYPTILNPTCILIPMFGECGSKFSECYILRDGQVYNITIIEKFCTDQQSYNASIESPIEQIFWDCAMTRIYGIVPQFEVDKYRVDFAIPDKKIAIELDGHDYHKTKEQRTNDAERERNIELLGWKVIRFTGSEVFKDVEGCVIQVNKFVEVWG